MRRKSRQATGGGVLCEHHPEHTEECGYVEAVKGHRCEHVHTDECYTDELICGYDDEDMDWATDSSATHVHKKKCYELDCPHERGEHDDDCGYNEAVKGHPCDFICDVCGKEEPDADSGNVLPEIPEPEDKHPGTEVPNQIPNQQGKVETLIITDFDVLDEKVQFQSVSPGTKLDELNLPATLGASGYTIEDDTVPTPEPITIKGVTWEPDEVYDDTAEQGSYIFTPVLPDGYTCAGDVELPEIYVRIGGQVDTLSYVGTEYSKNDVEAINAIIDTHSLTFISKDDPANWTGKGIVWDNSSPKRITYLILNSQGLSGRLDVSDLTALISLQCQNNQLEALDGLDQLTELTKLGCNKNQLKVLDLSENKKLTGLNCQNNQLETLVGLENLTELTDLYCGVNQLETLDVSENRNLTILSCEYNPLASFTPKDGHTLTVDKTTGGTVWMTAFDFSNNKITLKASPDTDFSFQEWRIPSGIYLDNPVIFMLNDNMSIKAVFAAANPDDVNNDGYHDGDVAVINGIIENNDLSATKDDPAGWETDDLVRWDSSTPKRITYVDIYEKGLRGTLDISALTNLGILFCGKNNLTGLNVSKNTSLTHLSCGDNQLKGMLDVSGLTELTELHCGNNQLTALNGLESLENLTSLYCFDNRLTALDVSGLSSLRALSCFDNRLQRLDVSGLTSLTILGCFDNQLTGVLDVSGSPLLKMLYCSNNQLTELNLSGLTSLTDLSCSNLPLTSFTAPDGSLLDIKPGSGGKIIFGDVKNPGIEGYYLDRKEVILSAVPDTGYHFTGWTRDGAEVGNSLVLGFILSGNSTVTANFEEIITRGGSSSSGGGGSIITVPTIKWIRDEKGWRLKNPDQTWATSSWKEVNGIWYHFNEEGYMQTGWYTDIDGNQYYLLPTDGSTQGSMVTGWQLIDDKWYYFNMESDGTKGRLLYNTVTPDGYYVNEKGEWIE
ncbi:leucine-rich repeat domain-containing protein [Enterocloster sp. OA13]|uniref:leucine-rich repeat domain-containing protein n=1 Tax=Enterocloster sp. OA13 TaxID=2914161 RepID=UPI0004BA459F|nr:leucine-rich repeat domain-containing protein [Enterocloster sp. OA13]